MSKSSPDSKIAKARANEAVFEAAGWGHCGSNSRILKKLNVPVVYVLARVSGESIQTPMAPAWAARLADLPFATKRRKLRALRNALADAELARAAIAMLDMGAAPAVVSTMLLESFNPAGEPVMFEAPPVPL